METKHQSYCTVFENAIPDPCLSFLVLQWLPRARPRRHDGPTECQNGAPVCQTTVLGTSKSRTRPECHNYQKKCPED